MQAKIASVPTAPRATAGLEKWLSGYRAAIAVAVAAGTSSVEAIMDW